jgi:photosystem II stability/assembly factor-like uncharacterized protein
MKAYIFIIVVLFLTAGNIKGQEYLRLMEDANVNFYDIQKSFNEYWKGRTPEKGQGWMAFKRWEYFMDERVFPSGKLPDPAITHKEITKYKSQHPDNVNDLSNWISLGPTSWVPISYNPGIGRINCIVQHPTNSNILFAGAPSGGLWKSTNSGANWTTATNSLTVLGVSSIVIHPTNTSLMYILTGDGDGGATYSIGVLKSTNGGDNWVTTGLSFVVSAGTRLYKLVMSPSNSSILLAVGNTGVYRSTNSGDNWTTVYSGNFKDIEFNPSNSNIIYCSGTTFIKSTDGGASFAVSGTGLPTSSETNRMAIGVSPANANYIYILASSAANSGFYGFYRSTDAGNSFVMTVNTPNIMGYNADGSSTGGQGTYDLAIAVSPTNINEVFTGGINVWKTTNAGANFINLTYWVYPPTTASYVHADIHTLDFFGSNLYSGCDGGLFRSTNWGANWTDLSTGMSTMQFYRIGGTPQNANYIIGGTQDNGTNLMNGTTWYHVLGADGMEAAVDPTTQSVVYACIQSGGLRRSTNGGNNFTSIVSNITGSGYWVTPYLIDPLNNQTLYAGYQDIWKSTNRGTNWTQLSTFGGTSFRSLAVCNSNPSYIYASTTTTVYRTTDGGGNWTNISSGLPGYTITYIAVHPTNANRVWLTFSGYNSGYKVYYTSDGGSSWNNISGTLPNLPANCITYLDPDRLFVGMDVGAYYRDNYTGGWTPFMVNLPNVIVKEFEVHLPSNKIRAATYGRGLWETVIPPIVGISGNNGNIPDKFLLYQNYPNPFNQSSIINFQSTVKGKVQLIIYDILGKEVQILVNEQLNPGVYKVRFDGSGLPSGFYFYKIQINEFIDVKKMVMIK